METGIMDFLHKLAYFFTITAALGELNVAVRLLVGRELADSLPFTFLGSVGAKSTKVQKAEDTTVTDVVSFDVTLGGEDIGTMELGLFGNTAPRTVENFVQLATREEGKGYQGSAFHRVIKDFMMQGGDYVKGDGSGEDSIYGGRFEDEKFTLAHYGAGWLSMANAGPDSNTCQFFITARNTHWLDGKHIVFGKVIRGMRVMKQILDVETDENDRPKVDVLIAKSSHSKLNDTYTVAKVAADWKT